MSMISCGRIDACVAVLCLVFNTAIYGLPDVHISPDAPGMMALRRAMQVNGNPRVLSWQEPDPCGVPSCSSNSSLSCAWAGVGCVNWRVNSVEAGCSSCGGSTATKIPASLSSLLELKTLNLSGNALSGSLSPWWSSLTSLEILDLSGNKLHGSLPDSWSRQTRLQLLDLSDNQLTGSLPSSWGLLHYMEVLALAQNGFTGQMPSTWTSDGMPNLRMLDLRGNCGMCGAVPLKGPQLSVLTSGTSLNESCSLLGCNSSLLLNIITAAAITVGIFATAVLGHILFSKLFGYRNRDHSGGSGSGDAQRFDPIPMYLVVLGKKPAECDDHEKVGGHLPDPGAQQHGVQQSCTTTHPRDESAHRLCGLFPKRAGAHRSSLASSTAGSSGAYYATALELRDGWDWIPVGACGQVAALALMPDGMALCLMHPASTVQVAGAGGADKSSQGLASGCDQQPAGEEVQAVEWRIGVVPEAEGPEAKGQWPSGEQLLLGQRNEEAAAAGEWRIGVVPEAEDMEAEGQWPSREQLLPGHRNEEAAAAGELRIGEMPQAEDPEGRRPSGEQLLSHEGVGGMVALNINMRRPNDHHTVRR